jgi:hypothetical protein
MTLSWIKLDIAAQSSRSIWILWDAKMFQGNIQSDCSETEEKAAILMDEYKLDYASCIGSLIYLSQT